mmetsp:Transcript_77440/g.173325  ORF Transcript_77440/g.173325 Transcript_77440/m.173325 type:complete len:477 (-) Transcript_77440:197-1627(-)
MGGASRLAGEPADTPLAEVCAPSAAAECVCCEGRGADQHGDCPLCEGRVPARAAVAPLKLAWRSCPCVTCASPVSLAKQSQAEVDNPQSGFWRHKWRLPGNGSSWTLSGHSRALERTGFVIEEPRIFLDAGVGWRNPTSTPVAILVTHGHIDHVNALPLLLRCNGDPAVFVPREHLNGVREMCRMTWAVKRPDGSKGAGERADVEAGGVAEMQVGQLGVPVDKLGLRDPAPQDVRGRLWVPVEPGCSAVLPSKQGLLVRTVECYHTVADIGYIVCETKKALRGKTPEAQAELDGLYARLATDKRAVGQAIGALRKSGATVEVEEAVPRLAFLCDTTVQVFGPCADCRAGRPEACAFADKARSPNGRRCPSADAAEAQVAAILACPTVVVECSFLGAAGMTEEESEAEAILRGHLSWSQLRPVVLANPQTTFVLVHFSERYTDGDIREHFLADSSTPRNIVLWLDSNVIDFAAMSGS